jgi:multifunctional methyltransferase subunit TRM112
MRLLSHNILVCNVVKCINNNLPFRIHVDKSEYRESEFNREHIIKLIRKLEWSSLYKTVTAVLWSLSIVR